MHRLCSQSPPKPGTEIKAGYLKVCYRASDNPAFICISGTSRAKSWLVLLCGHKLKEARPSSSHLQLGVKSG